MLGWCHFHKQKTKYLVPGECNGNWKNRNGNILFDNLVELKLQLRQRERERECSNVV